MLKTSPPVDFQSAYLDIALHLFSLQVSKNTSALSRRNAIDSEVTAQASESTGSEPATYRSYLFTVYYHAAILGLNA